ncbi:DnaJ family domain-containing protein [Fundidesulfovibrio putealis]|uniref:DnaJ family domain-containing protein n=1 Tax=Fundidesulfovibrio putealis TaxID=270496 RepID=UPI0003FFA0B0|nr:DnaJ family domain-containing protein [Fundidesulfovibrio putealis]
MIAAIAYVAEERIRAAAERGEFRNLPGAGKPLDLDADANIPPELRMAYTLLKNGGYLDAQHEQDKALEKRLDSLEAMLGQSPAERTKLRQMLKLQVMEFRTKRATGKELALETGEHYYGKVVERISVKAGKEGI